MADNLETSRISISEYRAELLADTIREAGYEVRVDDEGNYTYMRDEVDVVEDLPDYPKDTFELFAAVEGRAVDGTDVDNRLRGYIFAAFEKALEIAT